MATLVNYTCKSFIKLTPGVNLIKLYKCNLQVINSLCRYIQWQSPRVISFVFLSVYLWKLLLHNSILKTSKCLKKCASGSHRVCITKLFKKVRARVLKSKNFCSSRSNFLPWWKNCCSCFKHSLILFSYRRPWRVFWRVGGTTVSKKKRILKVLWLVDYFAFCLLYSKSILRPPLFMYQRKPCLMKIYT